MTRVRHIAVVDDDADVREMVTDYLTRQGFAVTAADGGAALWALVGSHPVDLVVLDVNMPGEDGLSIARRLRQDRIATGIVLLTANVDRADRIAGLEIGADDYVVKPFDPRELLARVRAVLRRLDGVAAPGGPARAELAPARMVRVGKCLLDLDAHRLRALDGSDVPLTAMEFDLLEAFVRHPNRALSRDRLLDLAHGKDTTPFDRSIDTRVTRLRRKVEVDPDRPRAIRTVRGAGYMFVPAAADDGV